MKWFSDMDDDGKVLVLLVALVAASSAVACVCMTALEIVKHLYPAGAG
jgi:hypothetical protein